MKKGELAAIRRREVGLAKIRSQPQMHPLIRKYSLLRCEQMSIAELSRRSNYASTTLEHWERPGGSPGLLAFLDALSVLGYRLEIVKND